MNGVSMHINTSKVLRSPVAVMYFIWCTQCVLSLSGHISLFSLNGYDHPAEHTLRKGNLLHKAMNNLHLVRHAQLLKRSTRFSLHSVKSIS